MSFFGNLYHGHYCPVEKTPETDEFRAASKRLAEASEKLFKSLNDGQKALLEEYRAAFDDCVDEFMLKPFGRALCSERNSSKKPKMTIGSP